MAAVAGLYGLGPDDRGHQRRRGQQQQQQQQHEKSMQTPDGLSEPTPNPSTKTSSNYRQNIQIQLNSASVFINI
ncbi:unnamed protein product [Chironomus riparius]|uniref:Uncharacterized protein n=1 Tax=Chironomus riparius TaxID=315576 RepID=A0A9N9RVM9_9DIPT|nr:unnamed protein product [Chironomus riparius]